MAESQVIRPEEIELLRSFRHQLRDVANTPQPTARLAVAPDVPELRSLAVFPGAFNPPTEAHLALAHAAREAGFDGVCFALGSVILAKPATKGLIQEDRLLLLHQLARQEPGLGVLIHNRGLYADQAEAVRRILPDLDDLAFLVGTDKLVQLFDPAFYDDMDRALERFFLVARLLVAPRADVDDQALHKVTSHPLYRRFTARVGELSLGPHWMHLSSTAVRERLERGEDTSGELPGDVRRFLLRTRPFAPDRSIYEKRCARIREADGASRR